MGKNRNGLADIKVMTIRADASRVFVRRKGVAMQSPVAWVGMDVHKASIVGAVVGEAGDVVDRWEIPNTPVGNERLAGRLAVLGDARCVYEAGPCGYALHRLLAARGIRCEVIAPALIPRKPGDRVKTDRRDAEKLARMHRMGELTSILVPTEEQEALRDLLRCREDARNDLMRGRHRLGKFMLRRGRRYEGKAWSKSHWEWFRSQAFDDGNAQTVFLEYVHIVEQGIDRIARLDKRIVAEASRPAIAPIVGRLRALRGIDTLTALTLVSELVDIQRFGNPRELMAFVGLVPSEHSSGGKQSRGHATKTGNVHARKTLMESAWHYRQPPDRPGLPIRKRRESQSPGVVGIALKAEARLHKKFVDMMARGKRPGVTKVAVARELAGFVWAVARAA